MNLLRRFAGGPRFFLVAGIVLLLLWAGWWGISLAQPVPRLWPGPAPGPADRITYIHIWPFVGIDFQHNYAAVNSWLAGHNPYVVIADDPMNAHYVYPPLTLVAFAWAGLFPPDSVTTYLPFEGPVSDTPFPYCRPAIFLWMAVIVLIVGFAAWRSWRVRERLRLPALPLPFILGAALLSYPVMFELERGNCDVLPLLAVALLIPALASRQRLTGDLLAAVCVALATGIKAYPGILLLGLIALRRFRAVAWPYLLWLTTMGTLVNTTAYDYSLIFLPLAALAAWSHRDPWWIHLCLLPALFWWQPFYLGVTGLPWLLLKVAGLFLVGLLVIRRLPLTAAPRANPARG
jgi:hypothetical protein